MSAFLKFAALALAAGLAAGPARAIDPFFPEFGNNGIDVIHYDLDLDVTPATGRLDAEASLKVLALQRLTRFRFDLSRLRVSSVEVGGVPAGFSQADGKLTIVPRRIIAKGDVFRVEIAYGGRPRPIQDPTAPGDPFYKLGWFRYGEASYALSEPVGASTFYPANDEPTDKARFTIAVTVPQGFTGVANGVLRSTTFDGGKKRFVWEMRQPMTTWLATVHVNHFRVRLGSTPDGTQLRVYSTAATPPEDVQRYALAREMLIQFERLIGQYPFGGYGSVIVDDPILYYALETQAMSTFPAAVAGREDFVSHELAHQWFGNSVSVARWRDLWIAEGAATYFEYVWEHRNNPRGFHQDMRDLYRFVRQEKIGPAVVESPDQMFTDRTYLRGAAALYALQLQVGERTFFRILRAFLREFRGGNATSLDFIRTAIRVSGDGSVRDLLHDWLYERPVPALPGRAVAEAQEGPVAPPDVVGLRCGPVRHRGAPATN